MLKLYRLRDYNFRLVLWLILISSAGVLLVGSAKESLQDRQILGVIIGLIVMVIVSLIDYSWILNLHWLIYFFNIGMLLFVYIAGSTSGGATRWLEIGGFRFQPTELSKILLVMFFARFLMKHEEDLNTLKTIVSSVILLAIPLVLIYVQPDLKNTITMTVIFCILMYIAGLSYKIIAGILAVALPVLGIGLFLITQTDMEIIDEYQKGRIMAWLNPDDETYWDKNAQQRNSIIAIGSGQLTGRGYNNNDPSSVSEGNWVPEIQTDFIFAVVGEELGFVGCSVIIILLLLITIECIMTSRKAKDTDGQIMCCGIGGIIGFQSFLNICVATGLFPNTGTPLPFVSYGLTSVVSLFIGMGLVLNVGLHNRKYPGGLLHEK